MTHFAQALDVPFGELKDAEKAVARSQVELDCAVRQQDENRKRVRVATRALDDATATLRELSSRRVRAHTESLRDVGGG